MTIRTLLLSGLACMAAWGADSLEAFGRKWSVPDAADWKVDEEGGVQVLHLVVGREPLPGARRPHQFAIAQTPDFSQVTVEADVKPLKRSVMIAYAYRDAAHFDYAHLSTDTAVKQPVHNGIFHVYGGERVRISSDAGPAAFAAVGRWYHVRLTYQGSSGEVNVTVDGIAVPGLHAFDLSLGGGKVAIGSFNETGDFKNVTISGR